MLEDMLKNLDTTTEDTPVEKVDLLHLAQSASACCCGGHAGHSCCGRHKHHSDAEAQENAKS